MSLKILQLCLRVPFAENDGGTKAMMAMANGLIECGHEVHMLALNTSKHYVPEQTIDKELKAKFNYKAVDVENDISIGKALANLFSSKPFHVSRFYHHEVNVALNKLLFEVDFDLVLLESLFTTPYLPTIKKANVPAVLRSHNVEHHLWQRVTKNTRNPLKKAYLQLQTNRLKKYEKERSAACHSIAAISPVDADIYKSWGINKPIGHVPYSVQTDDDFSPKIDIAEPIKMGFIGSMDWMPNQEGVRWFVKEIWPKLTVQFPTLECHIAGRAMPKDLVAKSAGNLMLSGYVNDVQAFTEQQTIMLAPLLAGGGVRIKVLEAMSMGKPVLATPIGYEGINAQNGQQIMAFKTADDVANHLVKAQQNAQYLANIGKGGFQLVKDTYNAKTANQELLKLL
ncbi:MAG: glycosyltransferase [Bacteroidetes bacterium]|nr:glycosyltransferase [Bacteroidota bacterium]